MTPIKNLQSNLLIFLCLMLTVSASAAGDQDTSYIEGVDYIVISQAPITAPINNISASVSSSIMHGRLLDTVVGNFTLPSQDGDNATQRIQSQYNWYKKNPEYMQRVWSRAEPYLYHIRSELAKRNMPMELALLPIVESAYDPFAYSHGRAAGLWQIIPGTGKYLGVKQNWWYDGRRDVLDSTDAALDYLESLHKQFKGDWLLAIAAYNSGPGNVRKGIRRNKNKNKALDFWSLPLPQETKAYVPKLLALKKLFLEHQTQTLLPYLPNQAYFSVMETDSQIDLATAAKLAGVEIDVLYQLNPGFNHWATAPDGPHRLLVPAQSAGLFNTALTQLPESQRIKLQRYKVKSGDTISTLAKRNKTSIRAIQEANSMRGNSIRAGKYLLIPQASTDLSAYVKSKDARLDRIQSVNRSGDKKTYTVRSGDSFWSIGKKYGVTERQLARWNGMAPRDTLKIGQKLVIWSKNKNANTSSTNTFSPQTQRRISYKVRTGDTLSGIAAKFKVKTTQLKAWNKNRLGKYLKPGQTLKILVDVRKQSS